ncbi:MAG TPA: tetratricopeptide repeat protein [Polyangiaceae bacterium]|jgi:tetratricopeptide (TPR) repeat protein
MTSPPSSGRTAPADLHELLRVLSLASGFMLVPVEVAGPDAARGLAAMVPELAAIEPVDEEGWTQLVARLLDAGATDARAVMLVGPAGTSAGLLAALRLVNQRRDSIVEALARPLLWCGPPEFLKLTWERAPDFWSIRAMTLRFARSADPVQEAPLWPGAWVADPPERLRELLAMARRQGDERNAERAAASLAEALVARGELDEATEVLAESGGAPPLRMVDAVASALRGARGRAASILEDAAWAAQSPALEGRRLVALGNLAIEAQPDVAVQRYAEAREVLRAAGDLANEAVAVANLGVAAMAEGDFEAAGNGLVEALGLARGAGDVRTEARILSKLGRVQLLRRDSRRACATLEEALQRAVDVADRRIESEVLRRLARAYIELGDPEKAEGDARRAAEIARDAGDEASVHEAKEIAAEAHAAMEET